MVLLAAKAVVDKLLVVSLTQLAAQETHLLFLHRKETMAGMLLYLAPLMEVVVEVVLVL